MVIAIDHAPTKMGGATITSQLYIYSSNHILGQTQTTTKYTNPHKNLVRDTWMPSLENWDSGLKIFDGMYNYQLTSTELPPPPALMTCLEYPASKEKLDLL